MHLASFEMVDQILTLDTAKARQIPGEVWSKNRVGYSVGYGVRVVALTVLIFAFVAA